MSQVLLCLSQEVHRPAFNLDPYKPSGWVFRSQQMIPAFTVFGLTSAGSNFRMPVYVNEITSRCNADQLLDIVGEAST